MNTVNPGKAPDQTNTGQIQSEEIKTQARNEAIDDR